MRISAVWLGALGVVLSFGPGEALAAAGGEPSGHEVLLAQLLGALALGWAVLMWLARNQRIGGIYNRPLALGAFLQFTMGGLTLLRVVATGEGGPLAQVLVVPFTLLAVWWGATLFTSPV